ncbi:Magnesium transporter MgtE [Flagellimonas maritima]|uniref:Magnesium transporter MgtE n=1 Tax=Flagellimonas maritima TaxID=1383885 RepID=A0A2Z4LV99_9FLAO|nr:magnesium transporter [Allomuricauda aurantiaca]AWX45821.1 Magnesium transporter MgtE [Allomuricauda aurantiaca]
MIPKAETVENALRIEYFTKYPRDAAHTLESVPQHAILEYLKDLPFDTARAILFNLNPDTITDLISMMDESLFIGLFANVNTHLGARLLSRLNKEEVDKKLGLLPNLVSREIKDFLNYRPDTAGHLMETSVITFFSMDTVEDVLRRIRKLGDRKIAVVYIIDNEGILLGKVPVQLIAISEPTKILIDLMERAPSINAMASREEVLKVMDKEDILQIPVIDIHNNLLGVIRNDTLISETKKEITEDLQAMFGAGREEQAMSKISFAVRKRLPWLQVNLATAFLASMVVGLFEDTIAKITILAIFLPVVAGQSGNTGSQALAVTMRGLALKEIRISQWFKVARKEIMVGFINGVAVALTTGIIVYFWASSTGIAIVIGISMIVSMVIAGFAGAIIPIGLKAIGQDPATSSSIILTTVTDICGFLSFLGLATALSSILGIV